MGASPKSTRRAGVALVLGLLVGVGVACSTSKSAEGAAAGGDAQAQAGAEQGPPPGAKLKSPQDANIDPDVASRSCGMAPACGTFCWGEKQRCGCRESSGSCGVYGCWEDTTCS